MGFLYISMAQIFTFAEDVFWRTFVFLIQSLWKETIISQVSGHLDSALGGDGGGATHTRAYSGTRQTFENSIQGCEEEGWFLEDTH